MFFGSFWHSFGYMNSTSNLENVLKQENLTTETILDQENVVNEVKMLQSKFTTFLKKNSHITHQMIEYSISMPNSEDNDEKKLYKYPFVSSEIFGTSIKGFEELFFEDQDNKSNDEDEEESFSDVDDDEGDHDEEKKTESKKEEEEEVEEEEEEEEENAEKSENKTPESDNVEISEDKLKTDETSEDTQTTVQTEAKKSTEDTSAESEETPTPTIETTAATTESTAATTETTATSTEAAAAATSASTKETTSNKPILNETPSAEPVEEKTEKTTDNAAEKEHSPAKSASPEQSPQKKSKVSKPKQKKYTGEDLLNRLMQFINTSEPLNDTLAGYFLKIVNTILTPNKQLFEYIATKPEILEQLVSHIRTKSISEIVLKLITVSGSEDENESVILQRKRLLELLGQKFSTGDSFERENISYIFYEIISSLIQGEGQPKKCCQAVQTQILEESLLANFFQAIVSPDAESSCIAYGATILSILVTYYNSRIRQKRNTAQTSDEDEICNTEDDKLAFPGEQLFLTYLPQFIEFIGATPNGQTHTTSYGAEITPFGIGKLKLVDLFGHIFKSENTQLITFLAKNNIFTTLLKLMIDYPWNNLLHIQIEKIILEGINMAISGTNDAVQSALFGREFNLLDFIAKNSQEETARPGKISKDIRLGYIGFLTNFAKKLNETTSCIWLNELKEGETWKDYTDNKLQAILSKENQNLGGVNPKNSKEEDTEDINKFEIDIQRIYEKFNNYFKTNKTTKDEQNTDSKDTEDIPEDDNINDKKHGGSSDEDEDHEYGQEEDYEHNHDYEEHVYEDHEEHDHSPTGDHIQEEVKSEVKSKEVTVDSGVVKSAVQAIQKPKEVNPVIVERLQFQNDEIKSEFQAHQFWKVSSPHNIDDLMDEL